MGVFCGQEEAEDVEASAEEEDATVRITQITTLTTLALTVILDPR